MSPQAEADRDGSPLAGSGETAAPDFGALFAASFRALWLIAYGVVQDRTLAEDVVQEAAVIALSKMQDFRPGSNFTAWMAKIVQFVGLNLARSRRRRRTSSIDGGARETPELPAREDGPTPLSLSADGQLPSHQEFFDDRIVAALQRVSETARICLLLRTIEGLEYAEISRLLKIPEGTAMSHVHRTRQFLRTELADLRPVRSPTTDGQA